MAIVPIDICAMMFGPADHLIIKNIKNKSCTHLETRFS